MPIEGRYMHSVQYTKYRKNHKIFFSKRYVHLNISFLSSVIYNSKFIAALVPIVAVRYIGQPYLLKFKVQRYVSLHHLTMLRRPYIRVCLT